MAINDQFEERWNNLLEDVCEYENEEYEEGGYDHSRCPKPCPRPCPKPCPRPCPKPYPRPCPKPLGHVNALQAQLINSSAPTVLDNSPVIFNTIINSVGPGITYNAAGVFIITKPGVYAITWWVTGAVPSGTNSIDFAIRTTSATPVSVAGSFPIPTTATIPPVQVDGNALITVLNTPATLSLVNISGATVTYATTVEAQASIVITEITA